jgi:ABC-type branched-subunit amino acid transport system substrate-binding protein
MRPAQARVATALAVLGSMTAIAACGGSGEESSGGARPLDLKIGNLVPKTGFLNEFGEPAQQAADLAVDEIRRAAAKAGARHRVTISHADYQSLPMPAVQLAGKMVDQGASCLLGPWGGGETARVVSRIATPKKVLQMTPSASGAALSRADDSGYLQRLVPPDRLQADALAELIDEELRGGARGKKVNVAASDSDYGKQLVAGFKDAWTGKGGTIAQTVLLQRNQPTYDEEIGKLASVDPDAWVFFEFTDVYGRVANDLLGRSETNFSPKRTFATDSLAHSRLLTSAPQASDGLRGVAISAPRRGEAAREFDKRFKAKGDEKRQTFDAQQFDAVVLCYLSAVAAGSTKGEDMADHVREVSAPPGRKFTWLQLDQAVKALQAGLEIDYDGASGSINMNDDGDPTAGVYDVYEFRGGRLRVGEQIGVPPGRGGI